MEPRPSRERSSNSWQPPVLSSTKRESAKIEQDARELLLEAATQDNRGVYCTIHKGTAPKALHRPTEITYQAFQAAYDHFNRELFDTSLPCCLITLQRRSWRTLGYFWGARFAEIGGEDRTDEIAMNPQYFLHRPMRYTLGTLVHEMVHLWQQHYGKPSRGAYHNREWAAKMKAVGLHPSDTGKPGGREVGQRVSHYIVVDGAFSIAFEKLASDGFQLAWGELTGRIDGNASARGDDENRSNRLKYSCPLCDVNVWGKRGRHVICGIHHTRLTEKPHRA